MSENSPHRGLSRRLFLQQSALGSVALTGIGGILYSKQARAIVASDSVRPMA
jgi:alkaline phosphatase D